MAASRSWPTLLLVLLSLGGPAHAVKGRRQSQQQLRDGDTELFGASGASSSCGKRQVAEEGAEGEAAEAEPKVQVGKRCSTGSVPLDPPHDPSEAGFQKWHYSGGIGVGGWHTDDTRSDAVSGARSDVLESLEMECYWACVEKIKFCNYVVVKKLADRTCMFFSSCPTWGHTAHNEFLLSRNTSSENEYSWKAVFRMAQAELEKNEHMQYSWGKKREWEALVKEQVSSLTAVAGRLAEESRGRTWKSTFWEFRDRLEEASALRGAIIEAYEPVLRPHDEVSYMAWLEHIKSVRNAPLGTGYGAGIGGGQVEREELRVRSLDGQPDIAVKTPPVGNECLVHGKAVSDLDRVLARLDRDGETRHRAIEPRVPRILGKCTWEEMRMERIYPCLGLNLDLNKGLLPKRLEADLDLNSVMYIRSRAEGRRKSYEGTDDKARWAWLKEATGTEDPVNATAFSKGVMDATLDCVTHIVLMEAPPSVLARGGDGKVRLYRFDFGATDVGGNYTWCSRRDLQEEPLSESYGSGATMSQFPSPFADDRLPTDTGYLSGYNAVLAILGDL